MSDQTREETMVIPEEAAEALARSNYYAACEPNAIRWEATTEEIRESWRTEARGGLEDCLPALYREWAKKLLSDGAVESAADRFEVLLQAEGFEAVWPESFMCEAIEAALAQIDPENTE